MQTVRTWFSLKASVLDPSRLWIWLTCSLWNKALAKKRSTGPFEHAQMINISYFIPISQRPQPFWRMDAGFLFLPSWPEVRILYHQMPRTVMMAVIFIENFTCSKMLLLMACHSHCNHFPTMSTQVHGVICISNLIWTVRPLKQQKGKLLLQRRTGFCDGVFCWCCSQVIWIKLLSTYQLTALRILACVWIFIIKSQVDRFAAFLLVWSAMQTQSCVFTGSFLSCAPFPILQHSVSPFPSICLLSPSPLCFVPLPSAQPKLLPVVVAQMAWAGASDILVLGSRR